MPSKVPRSLKKTLEGMREEIGTDIDSIQDSIMFEANKRRRP
jgi:hypothetical protein